MRKLLIAIFVLLTAYLAYYGWIEYSSPKKTESENSSVGSGEKSLLRGSQLRTTTGGSDFDVARVVKSPSFFKIPNDSIELKDSLVEKVPAVMKSKLENSVRLESLSAVACWIGSICSWAILGITVFLQNITGSTNATEHPTKKRGLSIRSGVVGVLAVGAAVCPLTSNKLQKTADKLLEDRDAILITREVVDVNATDLELIEWKKKLHELELLLH